MSQLAAQPEVAEPHPIREEIFEIYRLHEWGAGYFDINDEGHIIVCAGPEPERRIDMHELICGLHERGLTAPVLLRFSDILAHRMRHLRDAFATAIAENNYRGDYQAVFPIKVNQQRQVVEEVYTNGADLNFGLEVGSKPELLAVMAMSHNAGNRLIICNGFKDDEYIEAVVLAKKLGRNIIPVIENMSELRLLVKHAQRYSVRPSIGVRVKLASQGTGRWRDTAGAKGKFGLFMSEVLDLIDQLRTHEMLDCLNLVHCHVGSQVQDIRTIKDAINELAHVFIEMRRLGANLTYVDVGGGLGVDYDGSQSSGACSINYSLEEYASDVVYRIGAACDRASIEHPTIVSESGRAMVAHHSVLVIDVVGANILNSRPFKAADFERLRSNRALPQPLRDMIAAYESIDESRLLECYHDAIQAREQALTLFNLGYLSLELRGDAERLFWTVCTRIQELCRETESHPDVLDELDAMLSDTYFCNFSVFQSLPDHWAIDQLFPIMPIHRLNERPMRRAVLADMTCDSDGKISRFIAADGAGNALPIHALREGEPYYLGVFLVGAYQETLGDMHNLFGDTHVVHVYYDEKDGWAIDEIIRGDTAREVLGYVQFDAARLLQIMTRDCERALRHGRITIAESRKLLDFYESSLNGYTYLEPE